MLIEIEFQVHHQNQWLLDREPLMLIDRRLQSLSNKYRVVLHVCEKSCERATDQCDGDHASLDRDRTPWIVLQWSIETTIVATDWIESRNHR